MIKYTNAAMRQAYHALNGLTHAFALKEDGFWKLYFGNDQLVGFHEGTYTTKRAAYADAAIHHPELIRY